ncbi:MAG TPA: hypothetical protein VGX48_10485 [Pyrinomonadaceae bacterium]|jgi:hypothetical protein|nr:hypothetical protein [Pyrinomonadaceae bacterium]
MDHHNLFLSRGTYNLLRLDHLVILVVLTVMLFAHWCEVNWFNFTAAFLWPDIVGTLPGMYWYYARTTGDRRSIPAVFHVLYNIGHSFTIVAVITGLWYFAAGGWEWAMLALPIHLFGDRSLFGNIYKPLGRSFEPAPHPAFVRFYEEYERGGRW